MGQALNPLAIINALKNQPNGIPGLNENGDWIGNIFIRTMTYAASRNVLLGEGELIFCTDTLDIFIGNGITLGGIFMYSSPRVVSVMNPGVTITNGGEHNIYQTPIVANAVYHFHASFRLIDASFSKNAVLKLEPEPDNDLNTWPYSATRRASGFTPPDDWSSAPVEVVNLEAVAPPGQGVHWFRDPLGDGNRGLWSFIDWKETFIAPADGFCRLRLRQLAANANGISLDQSGGRTSPAFIQRIA